MADRGRARSKPGESKDDLLALEVAKGSTVRAAAVAVGMAERTAYRRSVEQGFLAKVAAFRLAMTDETLGILTAESAEAARTLAELQRPGLRGPGEGEEPTPAHVRVTAAKAVLEYGAKLRAERTVEERLRRIEERLGLADQVQQGEGEA